MVKPQRSVAVATAFSTLLCLLLLTGCSSPQNDVPVPRQGVASSAPKRHVVDHKLVPLPHHHKQPAPAVRPRDIFISPHQDDETLSMGAAIIAAVAQHHDVWVVMVGDGTSSAAGIPLCKWGKVCLSHTEIGKARDREAAAAIAKLGAAPAHVKFLRIPESQMWGHIDAPLRGVVKQLGTEATYHSMSFIDRHTDHLAIGMWIDQACQGKVDRVDALGGCRFYQSYLYQQGVNTGIGCGTAPVPLQGTVTLNPTQRKQLVAALDEYDVFDPARKRYAIGAMFSVPEIFKAARQQMVNKFHGPSSTFSPQMWAQDKAFLKKCVRW